MEDRDGVLVTFEGGAHLIGALKKIEPETEKATIKALKKLSVRGKTQLMANSPVGQTGLLRRSWTVSNVIRPSKGVIQLGVSIKWPSGIARYPFILEHGRPTKGNPLRARRYIAETRKQIEPGLRVAIEEILNDAARAFDN
jgi:hypothetical protein